MAKKQSSWAIKIILSQSHGRCGGCAYGGEDSEGRQIGYLKVGRRCGKWLQKQNQMLDYFGVVGTNKADQSTSLRSISDLSSTATPRPQAPLLVTKWEKNELIWGMQMLKLTPRTNKEFGNSTQEQKQSKTEIKVSLSEDLWPTPSLVLMALCSKLRTHTKTPL